MRSCEYESMIASGSIAEKIYNFFLNGRYLYGPYKPPKKQYRCPLLMNPYRESRSNYYLNWWYFFSLKKKSIVDLYNLNKPLTSKL